jgi:hypothetical protein
LLVDKKISHRGTECFLWVLRDSAVNLYIASATITSRTKMAMMAADNLIAGIKRGTITICSKLDMT